MAKTRESLHAVGRKKSEKTARVCRSV